MIDHVLYCVGDNSIGQCGYGNNISSLVINKVKMSGTLLNQTIIEIEAGLRHSLVLTSSNYI